MWHMSGILVTKCRDELIRAVHEAKSEVSCSSMVAYRVPLCFGIYYAFGGTRDLHVETDWYRKTLQCFNQFAAIGFALGKLYILGTTSSIKRYNTLNSNVDVLPFQSAVVNKCNMDEHCISTTVTAAFCTDFRGSAYSKESVDILNTDVADFYNLHVDLSSKKYIRLSTAVVLAYNMRRILGLIYKAACISYGCKVADIAFNCSQDFIARLIKDTPSIDRVLSYTCARVRHVRI